MADLSADLSEKLDTRSARSSNGYWGVFWLALATIGACVFFWEGFLTLADAWTVPEYSHGPLIPVLSGLLFLRQLKDYPVNLGDVSDRWQGVTVLVVALCLAFLGKLAGIGDIVAYAMILWVGAILLISFGWNTGKHFWPPVLHLVYMLPLPGILYYKLTTSLQFVSSEFGVWLLRLVDVPVFLDGNIIDLGVYKLHVAEACSGLRYLFPILSFSYIFAVLYKGPMWHKAVLLISAAPITVFMNSVRIGIVGMIVNSYGIEHAEGISHLLEGWVIFLTCIVMLFGLAWILLRFQPKKMSLVDALDLDTDGLGPQAKRILLVQPSKAMIFAGLIAVTAATAWHTVPRRAPVEIVRSDFALFPVTLGEWRSGPRQLLSPAIEDALGADDYHSVSLRKPGEAASVDLFMAYYEDQTKGGIHSPEVCIPGAGWEMAEIKRIDISAAMKTEDSFNINRAIIQKGTERLLVYYWFEQHGKRIAWDYAAKANLLIDGVALGRTDGALVRLITPIEDDGGEVVAEERLREVLRETLTPLPRFVPVAG